MKVTLFSRRTDELHGAFPVCYLLARSRFVELARHNEYDTRMLNDGLHSQLLAFVFEMAGFVFATIGLIEGEKMTSSIYKPPTISRRVEEF